MTDQSLGPLEKDVLNIIWEKQPVSVHDIRQEYAKNHQLLAYNTILTIVSRLYLKNILRRIKQGRVYIYTTVETKPHFVQKVVQQTISSLISNFGDEAVAAFSAEVSQLSATEKKQLKKKLSK